MSEVQKSDTVHVKIPRNALIAGGGVALVGLGLAAGVMLRAPSSPPAPAADANNPQALMQSASQPATTAALPASAPAAAVPQPAPVVEAPVRTASHTKHKHEAVRQEASSNEQATTPMPTEVQARPAAPVCATCGVIESVRAVQQQRAQGSGLGAVAGGVLGGLAGNQMGKGNGRTAMTVLGAIGGGFAGNEVEKRTRTVTVYEVNVRMDDGSVRTFTQQTEPAPGTRVEVDGQGFHNL
ncbi:MAG: glycine zipper 2TM domain-containing protein [Aquabacterium sp.]